MGKWAEVACACLNRVPVGASDSQFDRPHRRKRRLTKQHRQELEHWKQTKENMYECGHRNGMIVELWPGDIIDLSRLAVQTFKGEQIGTEIFAKVGDFRNYHDELLVLPPREARMWLESLSRIQEGLSRFASLDHFAIGKLIRAFLALESSQVADLERRFYQVAGSFASVGTLRQAAQRAEPPSFHSASRKVQEAVADAIRLCQASITTGNTIRLRW